MMRNAQALPDRRIFIFCDDPAHARQIAVTNFTPAWADDEGKDALDYGRWNEVAASRAGKRTDSGTTLAGNDVRRPGEAFDRGKQYRSQYSIACQRCPVTASATEQNLFRVLTALFDHQIQEVSLSTLNKALARKNCSQTS